MLHIFITSLVIICDILYVDIGSNNGETITNFIERKTEKSLNEILLNNFKFDMKKACILGFEPNSRWTSKLDIIKATLQANVSALHVYTNTAVVANNKQTVTLSIDNSKDNVGASIYTQKTSRKINANAIQLSSYLSTFLGNLQTKPIILIRMDIEGYEYELVPQLLFSGVLQNYDTYYMVEWHRYLKKRSNTILDHKLQHFNRANMCSTECSSLYQNLEKILIYMIQLSGAKIKP